METIALLTDLRLFQGLDGRLLRTLADKAQIRQFSTGELIFQQGNRSDTFFVLAEGAVKLFRSTAEGKEQTLYLVDEGEPFCLCTIFQRDSTPVNAEAIGSSLILSFPGNFFEQQARSEPQLLFNILHVLNSRLMHSMQMIEDLALRDIRQRTASFLLRLNEVHPESDRVTLSVSRREVAKILGTTPETISRVLAVMVQEGVIEAKGRQIDIINLELLRIISG